MHPGNRFLMCAVLTVLVGCAARGATAADPSSGSGTDVAGGNDGRSIGAGGLLAGLARRTKHHVDTLTHPTPLRFFFLSRNSGGCEVVVPIIVLKRALLYHQAELA
jgi:hypothetical protein